MQAFYLTFFLLLGLLGLGSAAPAVANGPSVKPNVNCSPSDPDCTCPTTDPACPSANDYIDANKPIPGYMAVYCSGHQVDEDARIKTMARMMDWCYCGNNLNPNGLEYAGFSVYEDGVDLAQRYPSRTWACSKNKHVPCDAIEDWYNAQGNISRECGVGKTGYFYDADRQIAWGFETYQDKTFCDNVNWVSSATHWN